MRVAGIGFRDGAGIDSLRWVLAAVEAQGGAADALATLPEKAPALRARGRGRGRWRRQWPRGWRAGSWPDCAVGRQTRR